MIGYEVSYRSYRGLEKVYNHVTVKPIDGNFKTVGKFHTNNIENFWSVFKRGIIGVYHFVSTKHLHRYCNEFGYRYSTRKESEQVRFEDVVKRGANKLLPYKTLINKEECGKKAILLTKKAQIIHIR